MDGFFHRTLGLNWGSGCIVTSITNSVFEMFGTQLANLSANVTNLNGDEFFGAGGAGGLAIAVNVTGGTVNSTSSFVGNVASSGGVLSAVQFGVQLRGIHLETT